MQSKCVSRTSLAWSFAFLLTWSEPSKNSSAQRALTSSLPAFLTAVCSLDKMAGSCLSRMLRYYYDSEERRCRPFIYTGCDGNGNNFLEFRDCTTACDSRSRSLELGEAEMLSELRSIMDKMAPEQKMALASTAEAEVTSVTTLEP